MLVSGDRHSPLADSGPQSLTLLCPTLLRKVVEPTCPIDSGFSSQQRDCTILAEGVGFEPTVLVRGRQFSRLVHSTALPPLRGTRIARARYCKVPIRSSPGIFGQKRRVSGKRCPAFRSADIVRRRSIRTRPARGEHGVRRLHRRRREQTRLAFEFVCFIAQFRVITSSLACNGHRR